MRHSGWIPAVVVGWLVGVVIAPAMAFDEKKIKLDDLPKAVMAAAKQAFPDAEMVGATKDTDDDDKNEFLYVVEFKVDGKAVEVAIDADGDIEAIEREIDAADLPRAVTRAAARRFPNGKIAQVEEVSDANDNVVYELDIMNNGKTIELVMAPNGKILAIDDDGDADKGKKNDKARDDKKKDKEKDKARDDKKGKGDGKKDKNDA